MYTILFADSQKFWDHFSHVMWVSYFCIILRNLHITLPLVSVLLIIKPVNNLKLSLWVWFFFLQRCNLFLHFFKIWINCDYQQFSVIYYGVVFHFFAIYQGCAKSEFYLTSVVSRVFRSENEIIKNTYYKYCIH